MEEVVQERDDARMALEVAERQRDELRNVAQELSKLKVKYEHLKQDHDSLRISLDSSERIRKQQKDLIALLQRSSSVADNASLDISMNSGSGSGSASVSIASVGVSGSVSSRTLAAENRPWLNHNHSTSVATEA